MSRRLGILILFVLISLLTRGLFLKIEVLDIDESTHIVGSWQLLQGKLPYIDFIDNKPPLLYVYYTVAQLVFGRGMFAVHLFTALFTIPLTAFAASAFYGHSRTGVIAGILFLLYSAAFLAHDMHASNTEILMILPGAWALVCLRDEERATRLPAIALAGFLLGVGTLFKQVIAFWLPAILISVLTAIWKKKQSSKMAMPILIGILSFGVPLLMTLLIFHLRGGAEELTYWTVQNNIVYAANPIQLKEAIGRAASYLLPFLLITGPLWWCSFRSLSFQKSRYRKNLIGLLLIFSLGTCFIGFRFYPHYFIVLYLPLSLGAAIYVERLLQSPLPTAGKVFIAYTLFILIGFTIANAFLYFGRTQVYRETDPVFRTVSERLRKDKCSSGASLFVWGYAPAFYYYSRLQPASRFVVLSQSGLTTYMSGNLDKTTGVQPVNTRSWDFLMSDLEKNRATYILDTSPADIYRWNRYPLKEYPRLDQYVRNHYDRLDEIDGVVLYRRRDCK